MLLSAAVQQRVKHFDLLLAKELSLLRREYSQNLNLHRKLENEIRRTGYQPSASNRSKISIRFDDIYDETTESIDHHKFIINNHLNRKNRSSVGSTIISQAPTLTEQTDDLSDDSTSHVSFRRSRPCTKARRLPPIVKANVINRRKRSSENLHWMSSFERSIVQETSSSDLFPTSTEQHSRPHLPDISPIQRQVRSFLDTLPTYKGVQLGFDSFAPGSLYSTRAPIAMR